MMKIGVSGASGQLGSAVVQALAEKVAAENLVAISRTPKTDRTYAGRLGDYDQSETLVAAYQGLDRLLLIPGADLRPGIRSRQMLAAVDAAAHAQVGHVFLLSATGTQREGESAVGAAYWHSEQALIKSAIPAWTILRMSYFSETLVEEVRMSLTAGGLAALEDSRVSFVSRGDVAKAAAAALTSEGHEGAIYQLTGPETLRGKAVCRLVAQHIQRPFALNVMRAEVLRAALLKTGLPEVVADAVVSMKARQARGAYDIVSGDIVHLTGGTPCSLAEILASTAGGLGQS
ncbi:putative nucleoside-diphosphate-sugar epimerase [Acetobacter indonesiensis NRIC 0313]|uniref:Nucleoside-diphosphate sugar epimerase n=2 Tax=Acetobacter indonesiensis TaxID=104101 RepID=A0A252AMM0_9PROT|nr:MULTISPECIES: NAD(P)H-binding protein [Acetobacter]MCG4256558.1 NAD(P)H-binding protein [Acetobacter senegalensis]MCG4266464.1 NAD(P)H-binding protein [Acetobacter senegalensis]OUI91053.1 nucleoside-diphosphate sugar epimerase [Acetobacter indonesiensis]GBQ62198.1 putative nucleoside-diphosphate-sugar epimerase [Acetobacter indonesiensis NRIC 0313]